MEIHCKENQTILEFLTSYFRGASRATLRKKLAQKAIFVNDQLVVNAQHPLKIDDKITIEKKNPELANGIPILFEDGEIIVVVKPSGLLSVNTEKDTYSLHTLIKRHVDAPVVYPVHRLDRDTSGLIVFALTTKARDSLKKQLQQRTMKRIYHAILHGKLSKKNGTISLQLIETNSLTMKVVEHGGMQAITHYRELDRYKKTTRVQCELETGKKHQIRVSFASLGTPIIGDMHYGAPPGAKRLMLHACKLHFTHPSKGNMLSFENLIDFHS